MRQLFQTFTVLAITFLVIILFFILYLFGTSTPSNEVVDAVPLSQLQQQTSEEEGENSLRENSPSPSVQTYPTTKPPPSKSSQPQGNRNPWKELIVKSSPFQFITPLPDEPRPKPKYRKEYKKEPHRLLRAQKVLDWKTNQLIYPVIRDEKPINFDDVVFLYDDDGHISEVLEAQENYREGIRRLDRLQRKSSDR